MFKLCCHRADPDQKMIGTLKTAAARPNRSQAVLAIELWVQSKSERPLVCRNSESVENLARFSTILSTRSAVESLLI